MHKMQNNILNLAVFFFGDQFVDKSLCVALKLLSTVR